MAKLVWHGNKIKRRMARAARGAINEVAGEATGELRAKVPVKTGKLKRSIRMLKAEKVERDVWAGGVSLPFYGVLGKNRPIAKAVEKRMRAKLPKVVGRKFRVNASEPMGD